MELWEWLGLKVLGYLALVDMRGVRRRGQRIYMEAPCSSQRFITLLLFISQRLFAGVKLQSLLTNIGLLERQSRLI